MHAHQNSYGLYHIPASSNLLLKNGKGEKGSRMFKAVDRIPGAIPEKV